MSPPGPIHQGEIIPAQNAPPDLPKLLVAPTTLEPSMEVPVPIPPPGITLLLSPDIPSAACSLSRCHFPRHCHPPLWNTLQPRPWPDHLAGHENGQGLGLCWASGDSMLGRRSPAPVSLIPIMSQGPYSPPGDGSVSPRLCVPLDSPWDSPSLLASLGPTSIYLLFRHHPRASSTQPNSAHVAPRAGLACAL